MNESDKFLPEIIHPCITLRTGAATGSFAAGFDLSKALDCLLGFPGITDVRISKRLGLLKTYGAFRLILYKDGTFDLSPAVNPDTARKLLNEIGKTVAGAALCQFTGMDPALCNNPCQNPCPVKQSRIPLKGEIDEK